MFEFFVVYPQIMKVNEMKIDVKKTLLISSIMTTLLMLSLIASTSTVGETFSYTDPAQDVTKLVYNQGTVVSTIEGATKDDVDITGIEFTWPADIGSQNATAKLTFRGTPAIDEYHYYHVSANYTIRLNSTHYFLFDFSIVAGYVLTQSSVDAFVIFAYDLYNQTGVVLGPYGMPLFLGIGIYDVSYSISGTELVLSFGLDSTEEAKFINLAVNAESVSIGDVSALGHATDVPNFGYSTNDTGTLWIDIYPDDDTSNGSGASSTSPAGDTNETSDLLNETDNNNPLASVTPGYMTPLTVIALLSVSTVVIIRKRRFAKNK